MTVDPTVLRSESFAEVGLLIKRDVTSITERWSQRAAQEQPMAQRVHHQALLDHIPQLLDQIGNTLTESGNGHVAFHRGPASRHGEQRWDAGWSLTEVIRDYQILRLVLVDYLESTLDRVLGSSEHRAINLALDEAIASSAASYVNINNNHIQRLEKERADRAQEAAAILQRHAQQLQEAHRHK